LVIATPSVPTAILAAATPENSQVDPLGPHAGLPRVGGGQACGIPPGRDDLRSLVPRGEGGGAGEPAATPDDQHSLVFQGSGHGSTLGAERRGGIKQRPQS
jgi:hypothetical protein